MSLYEALDNFVGAGVLACAGMVGAEMPQDRHLDGAAYSRYLRAQRLGEAFGGALDALAHAIWMVQEQRGFSHSVSEMHALVLGRLLSEVRLDKQDMIAAIANLPGDVRSGHGAAAGQGVGSRLCEAWIAKANARGALAQPGIVEDVVRFLLSRMFAEVVEQPQLLEEMTAALKAYRDGGMSGSALSGSALGGTAPAASGATTAGLPAALGAATGSGRAVAVANMERSGRPALSEALARRFQALLAQRPMTTQQRETRLDELSGWLATTVAQLRQPANESADMLRLKEQAAAALEAGDLERASDLLKSVRERLRDERRGAEARIAEELDNLRLKMLDEAAATVRLGELAMARFDFAAAAEFFADAAGQLPAKETGLEFDYRQRHAEALAGHAEETSDVRVLEAAAQAFRGCRRLLVRERDPASWVRVSVGLGDMLSGLAGRAAQREMVWEEAAVSFAEAAEVIDPELKPMQWALVQISHASALIELGELRDRERHWKHAATVLLPTLDIIEARGAKELAAAARQKLKFIAAGLSGEPQAAAPLRATS